MISIHGESLNEYYVAKIRSNFQARRSRLNSLRTPAEAISYRNAVRCKIRSIFNLPTENTPLNSAVVKTFEHAGIIIENLFFYSRVGVPVTANLYRPAQLDAPAPAIIHLMGHNPEGKIASNAVAAAMTMASQGYIFLIPDPIGQGERGQYFDDPKLVNSPVFQHNVLGKQLLLSGEFFGSWRAWDGIRALDYLLTRPDVDASSIGLCGCSGGGTMTTWLTALEERFAYTAPSCYITSWKRNVENELPFDIEQAPPGVLEAGLEMGDFLIAAAPRPVLIQGAENDFFDPRGTFETYEEVKNFYSLLSAEDNVECAIVSGGHGYARPAREPFYRFAFKHAGKKSDIPEDTITPPLENELLVCNNDIRTLPGSRMIREFAEDAALRAAALRVKKSAPELRQSVKAALGLGEISIPEFRVLRFKKCGELLFSRFALETEPGYPLATLFRISQTPQYNLDMDINPVRLYVAEFDSKDELKKRTPDPAEDLYALDVRGIGENLPSGCDQPDVRDFFHHYQFDYHFAVLAFMCGTTALAGKVKDILSTLELPPFADSEVTLEARGLACYPAVCAALLAPDRISRTLLYDLPQFWEDVPKDEVPELPISSMAPGILKECSFAELLHASGAECCSSNQ